MNTINNIPSPFNFDKEPRICPECDKPAVFVGCDIQDDTEHYRCECGELEFDKPAVKN